MRIVAMVSWEGVKPEQYDELRNVVGWERDPAKGLVSHVACFDSKGIRVTDVWESKEDLDAFFAGRLGAGFKKVGVQGQPSMEIYPLHALFQSGGGRR